MPLPFLNPWLLLAAGGIAVPIVIHLLSRHRYRRIDWAAMELLRKVQRFRARRLRLEDLLLLLLRCLAVLFVVLAVARPTTKWFGAVKKADVGLVVAIDGSYSMAHKPGLRSRFDEAIGRVREVLGTVEPGNPVTLVLMGNHPQVLLRSVGWDPDRFEAVLSDLEPLPEGLNLARNLSEASDWLAEIKAPQREVHLVTDGQATTWAHLSEAARRTLDELADNSRVFVVCAPAAGAENLAVTRFELASGALRRGEMARCVAEVGNFGKEPQVGASVELLMDGEAVAQAFLGRLEPGQSAFVPLYVPLVRGGMVQFSIQVGPDAVATDNARYAVARICDRVRVLCVDGNPSERAYGGATDFLMAALGRRNVETADSSLVVESVSWLTFPAARLSEYDIIMLANVPDIPEEKVAGLYDFVAQGGGLVVFVGDNVRADLMNWRLRWDGAAILPAELEETVGGVGQDVGGRSVDPVLPDHPLLRSLESLPADSLAEVRFRRIMGVRVLPEGRSVLRLAGAGEPVLLERTIGRGKVLLFTSTANRDWNNMVTSPMYPLLIGQLTTYLTRLPNERAIIVGQPMVLPMPGAHVGETVTVTDPVGAVQTIDASHRDGQMVVELPETRQPGFYKVQAGEGASPLPVAANVDVAESDVKCLEGGDLVATLADLPVRVIPAGEGVAAAVQGSRLGRELWPLFLFAAAVAILLEILVAKWYSRRRAQGAPATGRRD